ncbi:hypothetical protein GCM10025734_59970 [Kitasatospora paranensis]
MAPVPVADGGEEGLGAVAGGGELLDQPGGRVGDGVAAGAGVEVEFVAGAGGGEHRVAGFGVRVGLGDPVRADVDDTLPVDLQAFVEGADPARAHPAAGQVAGVEAAGELQRQRTGQGGVDLVDVHPAGRHVDRLTAAAPGVLRPSLGARAPHLLPAAPARMRTAATAAASAGARVRQALAALAVQDPLQVLRVLGVDLPGVVRDLPQVVAGLPVQLVHGLARVLGERPAELLRPVLQRLDDPVAHAKLTPASLDRNACA